MSRWWSSALLPSVLRLHRTTWLSWWLRWWLRVRIRSIPPWLHGWVSRSALSLSWRRCLLRLSRKSTTISGWLTLSWTITTRLLRIALRRSSAIDAVRIALVTRWRSLAWLRWSSSRISGGRSTSRLSTGGTGKRVRLWLVVVFENAANGCLCPVPETFELH